MTVFLIIGGLSPFQEQDTIIFRHPADLSRSLISFTLLICRFPPANVLNFRNGCQSSCLLAYQRSTGVLYVQLLLPREYGRCTVSREYFPFIIWIQKVFICAISANGKEQWTYFSSYLSKAFHNLKVLDQRNIHLPITAHG